MWQRKLFTKLSQVEHIYYISGTWLEPWRISSIAFRVVRYTRIITHARLRYRFYLLDVNGTLL